MKKEQLNMLATSAQKGCVHSRDRILSYFTPIIRRESQRIWYLVKDETFFEAECYKHILQAIKHFNPRKGDFISLAMSNIFRKRREHICRYSIGRDTLLPLDHGEVSILETLKDDLADVPKKVLLNEKVALLAEGDIRKRLVLNEWMKGCADDSSIAAFLAKRIGGKKESHRRFITRFRTSCREILA